MGVEDVLGVFFSNSMPLKALVTYLYVCRSILLHDCTNIIIFPDWKVFAHSILFINTVQYY